MIGALMSKPVNVGTYDPLSNFWYQPIGGVSSTGVSVTPDVALTVSTVFACIRVLGDALGILPCHVYQRTGEQQKRRAPEHEFYRALHSQPNVFQTPIEWRSMGVAHLGLRGNFYSEIVPPTFSHPYIQLMPRHPDRMQTEQLENGRLRYEYTFQNGQKRTYKQDAILHIKLLTFDGDGIIGTNPIQYARDTIGIAKSRQKYMGDMYSGGGFIKYFLKTTKRLGVEGRKNFRDGWRNIHANSGGVYQPPILEDDMDLKTVGMSAEDLQTIESENITAREICQFYGVPPHMVHILTDATYSNIEHQGISFKSLHLAPYAVRFEQAVGLHFSNPDDFYAEFLMDSLLRGDTKSRYEAYSTGLGGRPFLKMNEVRAKENLEPVEGGDEIAEPKNMEVPGQPGKQNRPPTAPSVPSPPKGEQARNVDLRPLVADVADRIVRREVGGLANVERVTDSGDERREKVTGWYSKHATYMAGVLQPLLDASGGNGWDISDFASRYCGQSAEVLAASRIGDVLAIWKDSKSAELAERIREALKCTNE